MFASLLASGWINALLAQISFPTTNAIIGKVFHEACQTPQGARGHNQFSGALRFPLGRVESRFFGRLLSALVHGRRSQINGYWPFVELLLLSSRRLILR